jgi:hypothetical protein
MPQPWGFTLHLKVFFNLLCHFIDMCKVMPEDEGITKIKGSHEVVVNMGPIF